MQKLKQLIVLASLFLLCSFAGNAVAEDEPDQKKFDEVQAYQTAIETILPFSQYEVNTILEKANKSCDYQFREQALRNKFIIPEILESKRIFCYMDRFSRLIVRDNWEGVKDKGIALVEQCVELNGKGKLESCSYTSFYYFYTKLFSIVPMPFHGADADRKILEYGSDELKRSVMSKTNIFGIIMSFFSNVKLFSSVLIMSMVYAFMGLFALYVLFKHMNL